MLKQTFQDILKDLEGHRYGDLELEAEGKKYVRKFAPRERLIIFGCGHISQPLCMIASYLGFAVTVVDDREEFACPERFPEAEKVLCMDILDAVKAVEITENDYVAVVTRGHFYDAASVRAVMDGETMPYYLGMIGSRKRTAVQLKLMAEEGYPQEKIQQIHTPIGLDIGAINIREIAVSIVAELIQYRNSRPKITAEDAEVLSTTEPDMELLHFLAEDPEPKGVIVVYRTVGNSPSRSGFMMAIDKNRNKRGTVGGGLGENQMLELAYSLIGTGRQTTLTIRMDHDVASNEGMVCGGTQYAWIADVN